MTAENCIKFLEAYKEGIENPSFSDSQRAQCKKNFDMMKAHIIQCRPAIDHPLLKESIPKLKVTKQDGKKSKR